MAMLTTYLREMAHVRASGEATDETSYYAPLANLFNTVGSQLSPPVHCVLTPKNRGAGIPDGGLFIRRPSVVNVGEKALEVRAPERGVVEVKGLGRKVDSVARTAQVRRYLERYGLLLVTNYREFLQLRMDGEGNVVKGERYVLAADEQAFWSLSPRRRPRSTKDSKLSWDGHFSRMPRFRLLKTWPPVWRHMPGSHETVSRR